MSVILDKIKFKLLEMTDEPIDFYNEHTFQHTWGQRRFAYKLLIFIDALEKEHKKQLEKQLEKKIKKIAKSNITIELEINKELFKGDHLQLYIGDKIINIKGEVPDFILNSAINNPRMDTFILRNVEDKQVEYIKQQLAEVVKPTSIEEKGRMALTNIVKGIYYKRLKAVILYKNSIYRINEVTIDTHEDGKQVIFLRIA